MKHKTELSCIRSCKESTRHNVYEGRDYQNQHQKRKDDEQFLGALAHGIANDLTHRLAVVTDGRKQGSEILEAAEENTADYTPQEHRYPSEYGSLDRSVDRACSRDG